MSTPTTLSYLVQFKSDLSGLNAAVSWLNQAQQRVRQYNETMQNGARTVNNVLQAAAGYFAVGALRTYVGDAVKMRQAQSQLDQALRQSGKYSAEYSAELAKQADALETITGVDATRVQAVQRELVLAKVKKQDLGDLTQLTLDLAAAREVEAGAAAKLIGQTLRGDTDSIRGLGIELDLSKGRVEALKEALGRFRGQAAESLQALPQGMRDFQKASDDAKKAAGNLIIEFSSPALEGFSRGLRDTEAWLKRITGSSSTTATAVRSLLSSVGEFGGRHLTTILAVVAGFLALKAAIYACGQASVMLGSAFMGITGKQFLPLIAEVQNLSKEIGVLQATSAKGFAGKAGVIGLVAATAAASYELGKYLGGLKDERLRGIVKEIDAQNNALVDQVSTVKDIASLEAARARVAKEQKETAEQVAALEQKKASAPPKWAQLSSEDSLVGLLGVPTENPFDFSKADEARLTALQSRAQVIAAAAAAVNDPKWAESTLAANKPAEQRDAEILSQQLQLKREMFDLENQLMAAQTARNQPEIDRLQRLIEEKKLAEDLKGQGTEAAAMVQSRLKVEDEARAKARKEQADAFALATRQQEAELAANRAEQDRLTLLEMEKKLRLELQALGAAGEPEIQRRLTAEKTRLDRESAVAILKARSTTAEAELARVETARANITGSTLLDEATKRQRLAENTEEYRRKLAAVLELKLLERKLAVDQAEQAGLDAEIAALRDREKTFGVNDLQPARIDAARNNLRGVGIGTNADGSQAKIDSVAHYTTAGEGMAGGSMEFLTSIGTAADNAAEAVTGTLNTALSSTSDLLYNVISGATSFKDAWGQATLAVGQQFLRMATDMVAKMIWRSTIERALIRIGVIEHGTGEAAKTSATVAGSGIRMLTWIKEALASVYKGALYAFEAMASIPYVGPFLGAAAMAAAIAGGIALVGKIGHKDGGIISGPGTGTSDDIPHWVSNGEGIIPARRVQQYGPAFINSLINGTLDLAAVSANAQSALSARGSALQAASAPVAAAAPEMPQAGTASSPQQISLALFDNATSAHDYLASRRGRRVLANRVRRTAEDIG